jgi:hypothetical protein
MVLWLGHARLWFSGYRALTVSGAPFQALRLVPKACCPLKGRAGLNPALPDGRMVWALPGSLATTAGISVDFFSSGY